MSPSLARPTRPIGLLPAGALALVLTAAPVLAGPGPSPLPVAPAAAHTGKAKHDMSEFARTWKRNATLRKGCHDYRYRYRVKPPTDQAWGLETFLVGPGGKKLASGALYDGANPKKGRGTFRFCRTSTRPGVFKIKGKFTYYDGYTAHDGRIDPSRFRLRRP